MLSPYNAKDVVVLLHGLAETPLTMAALEAALLKDGYWVHNQPYPSTSALMETLADTFARPLLDRFSDARKVHFVTHSLGGVLLHACLQDTPSTNLGRVVMTAPGLQGSEALEAYRHIWLFRMMFGPAAFQSGTEADAFARRLVQKAEYELGVIAGCVSLDVMANLFIPWPHDGKISVGRTKIAGMRDHLVLPTPHDLIASDPVAIAQTLRFLRHGNFFHLMSTGAKAPQPSIAA